MSNLTAPEPSSSSATETTPDFQIVQQDFRSLSSVVQARRQLQRFDVKVAVTDLEGDDLLQYYALYDRAKAFQATNEGEDPRPDFSAWILEPCLEVMKKTAPAVPPQRAVTLQTFYYPESYKIALRSKDGELVAGPRRYFGTRKWERELAQTSDFPLLAAHVRFKASQVTVARDRQPGQSLDDIPTYVRVPSEGPGLYSFRPASAPGFAREVRQQWDIWRAYPRGRPGIVKIGGYVTSDDEKHMIGLLFEMESAIGTLQSNQFVRLTQYHQRWKEQVTKTVKALHKDGIAWGSPHPQNIVIDREYNARIADFSDTTGGVYIQKERIGTVNGDLEGIETIFGELVLAAFVENDPSLGSQAPYSS